MSEAVRIKTLQTPWPRLGLSHSSIVWKRVPEGELNPISSSGSKLKLCNPSRAFKSVRFPQKDIVTCLNKQLNLTLLII